MEVLIYCTAMAVGAIFPNPNYKKTFGERLTSALFMLVAAFLGTAFSPAVASNHPNWAGWILTAVCVVVFMAVRKITTGLEEGGEKESW